MPRKQWIIVVVLALAASCAAPAWPTSTSQPPSPTRADTPTPSPTPIWPEAKVVNVVDGDTVEVEMGGRVYPVRYIGIDCPEWGEDGYEQAVQANRQLVGGKSVRLVEDVSDTDQYGRLLRYVYVGDIFVNAELVRRGLATSFTYPPDVAYADLFAQLQSEAREAGRGLWAAPTPASETR